jgi:hypothetical protein
VQLEIELPTLWCANCHCGMCRQAHGAPFVTWVGVAEDRFRVVKGIENLTKYASSPGAQRRFCRECGSSMLFQSTSWPGEVHVARACIIDDLDKPIQAHAFFSDRAPWIEVHDDGLPRRG